MSNTTFKNNKNYGLNIQKASTYMDEFENNSFKDNDVPFATHPNNLGAFTESNSFSGNVYDHIYVNSYSTSIDRNLTWYKADVPYLLYADFSASHGGLGIFADVVMNPGVEVIMTQNSKITVGHFNQHGSLIMNGTANDEIIIRGEEATPAYWEHIRYANDDGQNKMSHVRLINGGNSQLSKPNGALLLNSAAVVSIDHITFEDCYDFGISLQNRSINSFTHLNLSFPETPREFGDFDSAPLNP